MKRVETRNRNIEGKKSTISLEQRNYYLAYSTARLNVHLERINAP